MDWSKAKTILIGAFVVINLFLASRVFFVGQQTDLIVSYEVAKEALSQRQIVLDQVFGEQAPVLPLLEVEYMVFDKEHPWLEILLGTDFSELVDSEYFSNDDGNVVVIQAGKKLQFYGGQNPLISLEISARSQWMKDFFSQLEIDLSEYQMEVEDQSQDRQSYLFRRRWNDVFIENDHIRVDFEHDQLVLLEIQRIQSIRETQTQMRLSSPHESLLKLMKFEDIKNDRILDIQVVYYRNENLIKWEEVVIDQLEPVWKVFLESGITKYLVELE